MRRRNFLAAVLTGFAMVAAMMVLRGSASGPAWVLSLMGALAGCASLSAPFRQTMGHTIATAWAHASAFPHDASRIPWRAVLVLILIPDALLLLARGNGIQSGDSRPAVMTAISLTGDGNLELSELIEVYSQHHLFTAGGELPYFVLRRPSGLY
ncbi:MAG TPA: hypothetical protein VFW87_19675, partial [Pirellulales bacterium]|nr:hypothetical protein [Pirellulales bacterium]